MIAEFVRYGFPWSSLSRRQRQTDKYSDLRNPGWLPTAIVVNILAPGERRKGSPLADEDALTVEDGADGCRIILPTGANETGWEPSRLPPVEVIDGQHRLWAFDEEKGVASFELPVVAFVGLDLSWQAYLFWSINITPKRINPSLAFDLYPLLRSEEWLQRFEGPVVYRDARAQELTELLWAHPLSPWHQRINMLGEPGKRQVTQAGWIRSLTGTFIKAFEGRGVRGGVGGLFGAPAGADEMVLPWSKAQQAAFLIEVWRQMQSSVESSSHEWAEALRSGHQKFGDGHDPAFAAPDSLLASEQGVRGFLSVTNDSFFLKSDSLRLGDWVMETVEEQIRDEDVDVAVSALQKRKRILAFMDGLCGTLASFDWRSSNASGLSDDERALKAAFRGSGGYRELRRQLLEHLSAKGESEISKTAESLLNVLRLR